VDVTYTVTMDAALLGSTDDDLGDNNRRDGLMKKDIKNDKKRAYAAMTDMSEVAKDIAAELKETNRVATESNRVAAESAEALKQKNRIGEEKNRLSKQSQMIAIASALGRQEILEGMLQSLASSSD
jgi:hypothetical protein